MRISAAVVRRFLIIFWLNQVYAAAPLPGGHQQPSSNQDFPLLFLGKCEYRFSRFAFAKNRRRWTDL
jgi:hypothetical protein